MFPIQKRKVQRGFVGVARTLEISLMDSEKGTSFTRPPYHSLESISALGQLMK